MYIGNTLKIVMKLKNELSNDVEINEKSLKNLRKTLVVIGNTSGKAVDYSTSSFIINKFVADPFDNSLESATPEVV